MDITQAPTSVFEGIGPAYSEELAAAGIHVVSDLLLRSPALVAAATSFSEDRIEQWRAGALLLEIEDMDPQWVEALLAGGIDTYEEFLHKDFEELGALFADAVTSGRIPVAPDANMLFTLGRRVAAAHYGAVCQGRVVDSAGAPVADVAVRTGFHETRTNVQGVWRLPALRAPGSIRLFLEADGYRTVYREAFPVDTDDWSTAAPTIELEAGASAPIVWDEFDGDVLPPLTAYTRRVLRYGVEELRERDLFVVHDHYADGDAQLVSLFDRMENSELQIRSHRVPVSTFPAAPRVDSHWRFTAQGFRELGLSPAFMVALKSGQQAVADASPAGLSDVERMRMLGELVSFALTESEG